MGVDGATLLAVLVPCMLLLAANKLFVGWALYSEEAVLEARVDHPLFDNGEHFDERYWRPNMTQKERLDSVTSTVVSAVQAFEASGAEVFLESSTLIGWLRHRRGHIPWDSDADLGITVEECKRSKVSKQSLIDAIDANIEVLKFACQCEEMCEGASARMVGRFAHRDTGVTVDVFSYAPVAVHRPWQSRAPHAVVDWWERVKDHHADYTFPRDALLPLRRDTWHNFPVNIPQDPRSFLSWEYGRCLEPHNWPWLTLLYTPLSRTTYIASIVKSVPLPSCGSMLMSVFTMLFVAVATTLFDGGILVGLLLAQSVCEFAWGVRHYTSQRERKLHLIAVVITMVLLLFDLRGQVAQVYCQLNDFVLDPWRPKHHTVCIFGVCRDFGLT